MKALSGKQKVMLREAAATKSGQLEITPAQRGTAQALDNRGLGEYRAGGKRMIFRITAEGRAQVKSCT